MLILYNSLKWKIINKTIPSNDQVLNAFFELKDNGKNNGKLDETLIANKVSILDPFLQMLETTRDLNKNL